MDTYAAKYYPVHEHEFEISTLFWGALIFLALFVSCFLAWKAIEWLRNRRKFDGVVAEGGHTMDPEDLWDQAISRPLADHYGSELGGLGGMTQREQEELFSTYAPRNVRKAMKARRKAREQAQKHQRPHP
ncbi:MAG: hypothetical protein QOC69_3977 [Mycobacterium sp.]|jgi:hypothetical protein|nr:hypothetical protein [Mycobacterium sp.]